MLHYLTECVPIDMVLQQDVFDCGVACLRSALLYFDLEAPPIDVLCDLCNTCEDNGTTPEGIADAANRLGLSAEVKEGMNVSWLIWRMSQKDVVLVNIQAWPDVPRDSFADDWIDGHWVIAVGYTDSHIILSDPSYGHRTCLTHAALSERWHDEDFNYRREGIAVVIRKPLVAKDMFEAELESCSA